MGWIFYLIWVFGRRIGGGGLGCRRRRGETQGLGFIEKEMGKFPWFCRQGEREWSIWGNSVGGPHLLVKEREWGRFVSEGENGRAQL
jgi:hypothetical protein